MVAGNTYGGCWWLSAINWLGGWGSAYGPGTWLLYDDGASSLDAGNCIGLRGVNHDAPMAECQPVLISGYGALRGLRICLTSQLSQLFQAFGGHRLAKCPALPILCAHLFNNLCLSRGFNAFCNYIHTQLPANLNHQRNKSITKASGINIKDKTPIDFQSAASKIPHFRQVRVTGAKVINRKLDSAFPNPFKAILCCSCIQLLIFGNFKSNLKSRLYQCLGDFGAFGPTQCDI